MRADASRKGGSPVRAENTSPAAFFEELYQTFERAEQLVGGSVNRFYTIGGHVVRLRFAGPALMAFIAPALEHLAAEPGSAPELTVCLWDSISTSTEMPSPPWSEDDYIARGEVHGYSNDHIHTVFHVGAGVLSMLDTRKDVALHWTDDARRLPYYESAAPLRAILHRWMRLHGRQLVHGGAVGTAAGGVLLAGRGGSGKSTAALACFGSELAYAGDDYCLVATDPIPYAYSLYNSAKLDADSVRRFPHLAPAISNADRLDTEKALLFLNRLHPGRMASGFPIRAIVLPQIAHRQETRLKKVLPAASLAALAPSTIFQSAGADRRDFHNLVAFVREVPSYALELGTELPGIRHAVLNLLSRN